VLLDHDRPQEGSFTLGYVSVPPFDAGKATVIVVSDGQQFFISPTAFIPTTALLFDARFNVVGSFGRGTAADLQKRYPNGACTSNRIYPDLEAASYTAEPLLALIRSGKIEAPKWSHAPLRDVAAQVVMLAGRWDHTCDHRSQIALAARYPNGRLFILDDDHTFHHMGASGKLRDITAGALSPNHSQAYRNAVTALGSLLWREWD
jgi:hypothetical protein